MIEDELTYCIAQELGFPPTDDQQNAMRVFADFMVSEAQMPVMLVRGSAGTGKTTLAGAIVRAMVSLKQRVVLMAPTGRAAKVFARNSGRPACTIHRMIFREQTFSGIGGRFTLDINRLSGALFFVDEGSMVANQGDGRAVFGTGRLLDDLITYVYSGRRCRLVIIGDTAQLPPIGEEESPALSPDVLRSYGLEVFHCDLTEVLRQQSQSGILYNATRIRDLIAAFPTDGLPKIKFNGFADLRLVRSNELMELIDESYHRVGMDEVIVVTRSNKRAGIYNQGIRQVVLDRDAVLCPDDRIMVVKNRYLAPTGIAQRPKAADEEAQGMSFIANGDRARVVRVRHERELYGFRFADVTLEFPDYDDQELTQTVILDSLFTDAPALTSAQNEELYYKVLEDYADVRLKSERMKKIREDSYFNALQIKYAYSVTCHKAQGGQWSHVYLDQGYMPEGSVTPDYIHWLYTAFTRATECLYLISWPRNQAEDMPEDD